ncbi:MAG: thiolase domain-containing protein [Phycisphaerales bacterium]|nr:MAG: thiolase domain-containing protein [Phycisphaerales bacterium]
MRDVAVIGVGMQKWGELWERSTRDIFVESALLAMDDAGVNSLGAMYIGSMTPGLFTSQEHLGSVMADYLGQKNIPSARVESACASGGLAFRMAFMDVASGMHDVVLAGGIEKMTDIGGGDATHALATAADMQWEGVQGVTFPGLYAMMAVAHMNKYGTTREQLAAVAVKNHHNGTMNPRAQFRMEVTVEGVINSTKVADPLNILDCSPITDGAAAVILVPADMVKKFKKPGVKVIGSGHATDTIALHDREDLTTLSAVTEAAEQAYKMSEKDAKDIDLAEVHDCFTIAEIIVSESLGLFERGKGGPAVEAGETSLGGRIPINASGGLKSKGHPVGATGVAQIVELTEQLRGEAGDRQVSGARVGLAQNMGGSGGSSLVHILEVM